ncbi:MAE_28990/MAE_18760 family HEPN-like nuclease [Nocardia vulneris]|uniref:MAE_28990/MAE_18760 family HEPN-like nuclease n=1 Tax=Nocardia vulneris TaxID=1141657 RepID=UPI000A9A9F7D|nr:MAE_28990/MAE_18760 family HEPN-like nuclease [Nocardia vulneris]
MSTNLFAPVIRLNASVGQMADFFRLVNSLENLRKSDVSQASGKLADSMRELSPILAGSTWRSQTYGFSIILIYTIHERFVRDLMEVMTQLMAEMYSRYEDLPDVVRSSHLEQTLSRFQDLARRPSASDGSSLLGEIYDLAACLDGTVQLNSAAMSHSSANFKPSVIRDVLRRLDFALPSEAIASDYGEFPFGALNGIYTTPESVLDDLTQRRNVIAHGADPEIMDLETLRAVAAAIYRYDLWIFRRIAHSRLFALLDRFGIELGTVRNAWKNSDTQVKSIVNLLDVSVEVRPGSLVYQGGEKKACYTINSIQVDRTPVPVAMPGAGPFGVDLGVTAPQEATLMTFPPQWQRLAGALSSALTQQPTVALLADD